MNQLLEHILHKISSMQNTDIMRHIMTGPEIESVPTCHYAGTAPLYSSGSVSQLGSYDITVNEITT